MLENVEHHADELHELNDRLETVRANLYAAIRAAQSEGVPAAKIARAARLSRERVRQIVQQAG